MTNCRERSGNTRGALWMIASAVIFTINAAVVKELGATGIDSFQTVFVRSLMGLIVPLPFLLLSGMPVRSRQPTVQVLQATAGTLALMSHFYAWTKLPLATVTTLIFTQPLFTLLLAVFLLGALIRWQRWVATGLGFVGVVIMVRPESGSIDPAAVFALFAGFLIALQLVLIARLPSSEKELTMLFYLGAVGTLITVGPGLTSWQNPGQYQIVLLFTNGVLGVAAQACTFRAFRVADAAYIAPFDYSKLIVAGLIGFVGFDEIPTIWTLSGASLIVLSTFYISRKEHNLSHRYSCALDISNNTSP